MIPLSILDLSPITEGGTAADALNNSLDFARNAEKWGFNRYWLAEHHNMKGIASAATAVAISHVASGTKRIRVGAGGIMLPNHAPLVIAEQFGTLETLFPGRIDLGLGRAPGTDQETAHALRRNLKSDPNEFPRDVIELQTYFSPASPQQRIQAIPGIGLNVPIWILGSSLFGAKLAAMLGLPYVFASHFAPTAMMQALKLYRDEFVPSKQLSEPYTMVGINIFAAEDEDEAQFLRTSSEQSFVNLHRGRPGPLPPPVKNFTDFLDQREKETLEHLFACSITASPKTINAEIRDFIELTGANELIIASHIYEHSKRLRCLEIISEAVIV